MLNASLSHKIRKYVTEVVRDLIVDPTFKFRIDSVEFLQKKVKSGGGFIPIFNVKIHTNNRPLLLGQFVHFPVNGYRGFHNNWIEAYVQGFVRGKFAIREPFRITVDAYPTRLTASPYTYITLERAVRSGILGKNTPLVKKMKQYNLNHLLLAGSSISGPDIDFIEILESIIRKQRPRHVLEVFGGTGSLSKVALANGATSVTVVDKSCSLARKTLQHFRYDLVIADPFVDQSLDFAEKIAPLCAKKSSTLFTSTGFLEDEYWTSRVARALRKAYRSVSLITRGRLVFAVCRRR
jgi:hypothetical protein